ncbi:MAG: sialate O-acetylesterase [Akkermansiaceae bacterium]
MKNRHMILAATAAVAAPFTPPTILADVSPAPMFSDNMVIQRNTEAPVWGNADAGEKVSVTASWGANASATADKDGKWQVTLKSPAAGGPHTIIIKGNNTVEINNVLSGEVWFCSGQSNMDFYLKQLRKSNPKRTLPEDAITAEYINKEVTTAADDQLRQFEVQKNTSPFEPLNTLTGSWIASSPKTNDNFSATAYFFARELRKELKVPVGIIKCAWGGTRVEPWIPADQYKKDQDMAVYMQQEHTALKKAIASWNPEKAKQGNKRRAPRAPESNQQMPTTLFNGMVNPVIPYAIKGAIWYQGESNASHNITQYTKHFQAMISGWREHWGQGDFPFYFAQLASFRNESAEPVEHDAWASICDQQRRTLSLKNTGMAVLNDIGEASDIHPHNKVDVGIRLALWALKNDYGKDLAACSGPLYKSHEIADGKVTITFDHAGSGLMTGSKNNIEPTVETKAPIKGFQICGKERKWQWAEATISGPNTVTVSHQDVPQPTVVRYAWAANPGEVNLYNKEGLPTSIFTTEVEIPAYVSPKTKKKK